MDDLVAKALHAARQHFDEGGETPVIPPEFTSDTAGTPVDFRPLNFDALRQANAVRVTNRANPDGTTDTDPNAGFSIVSGWNDAMAAHGDPRSTVTWPDNPGAYGTVSDMFSNNPEWITPHKYRQILHSARELGMRDEDVYAQPRASGGHVDAALHLLRQHFDEGGFLDSLRSYFTGGPEVLSTGEKLVDDGRVNWGNPESAADFARAAQADKALRLARQTQDDVTGSTPAAKAPTRAPIEARELPPPRQQVAAAAPAFRPVQTLPGDTVEPHEYPPVLERTIGPYDFGQAVSGQQVITQMLPHFRERPGFGQVLLNNKMNWADAQPEVPTSNPQKYTLSEAALAPPAPQAEINNAVSLARKTIPSAADALAAVEKLHNAGVYSGEALDKAGEILAAHNRAKFDNIPVEEALRLNRAAGPMMVNQGMPTPNQATQPISYNPEAPKNPARAAIDKITTRAPQEGNATNEQILAAIRANESRNNPRAQNPNSSAGGLYQFINSTWGNTLRRMDPEQYGGYSDRQLRGLKTDPNAVDVQHAAANYHLTNEIAPRLERAGVPLTPGSAYLSWFQGPGGAVRAYTAPDDATVSEIFPRTVSANANMRFNGKPYAQWTMADLRQWADTKMAARMGRASGGIVDDALHIVREHHANGEAVGQAPETNALGMTPDQFAEYTQTKAQPTPGFVESALRNVREYAMPRVEDYTHAMDQSAAAADYLTKSGKEGMLSGSPFEMAKGAGKSMLGTALPVIAPVGAALEAGIVNPAERVLGPAGRQAAEIATMVPGEGVGAALKSVAKYAPEISPVAAALSMVPKASEAAAPARELTPMGLYSHGAETAAGLPQAKGTPEQYASMLQKAGVKPVEMEGFREMFAGRPSVTREEVAQHFQQNLPVVEEKVLGQKMTPAEISRLEELDAKRAQQGNLSSEEKSEYNALYQKEGALANSQTKFGQYTLPGGENYREVLLKLPAKETQAYAIKYKDGTQMGSSFASEREARAALEDMFPGRTDLEIAPERATNDGVRTGRALTENNFRSSHWDDPNVLAHLRMADRTGPNGEKILHVEEIQSDWGQKGKKEGFDVGITPQQEKRMQELSARVRTLSTAERTELQDLLMNAGYGGVPTAPYVTKTEGWTDLALKRALKEAAEGGYDKLVWTPGAEQASRYPGGGVKREEGMKGYYDKIVPKRLQEIVKKHDPEAKIGTHDLVTKKGGKVADEAAMNENSQLIEQGRFWDDARGENVSGYRVTTPGGQELGVFADLPDAHDALAQALGSAKEPDTILKVPSLTITPKMRESILKGQTAYADGGLVNRALSMLNRI